MKQTRSEAALIPFFSPPPCHNDGLSNARRHALANDVFHDLPHPALELLAQNEILSHYKRGQCVFYAGNTPAGLHCIRHGVVKLETEGASGNGHILGVRQAGDLLGSRSLFADEDYDSSAVVHESVLISFIPKGLVLDLMKNYVNIATRLLAVVSKELRTADARLCAQRDKNAGERVAESVLFLSEQFPTQVWTRKEIAEWAGMRPETVMRALGDFEDRGLIAQRGRKIVVTNRDALNLEAHLV